MQVVRFGITGSGYMARTHAESIRRLGSAAKLVAIWGGSRAPDLAARFGFDCEATVEGLAKRPDIDAIVVTTPHQVHARDTLRALEAGKHALVEKPMATTLGDCDRMVEAAARRGRVLAVGYTLRFRVNAPRARELVAAGAIGRVLSMHYSMIRRTDDNFGGNKFAWMSSPEAEFARALKANLERKTAINTRNTPRQAHKKPGPLADRLENSTYVRGALYMKAFTYANEALRHLGEGHARGRSSSRWRGNSKSRVLPSRLFSCSFWIMNGPRNRPPVSTLLPARR